MDDFFSFSMLPGFVRIIFTSYFLSVLVNYYSKSSVRKIFNSAKSLIRFPL